MNSTYLEILGVQCECNYLSVFAQEQGSPVREFSLIKYIQSEKDLECGIFGGIISVEYCQRESDGEV